jgi:hypothetical protein
MKRLSYFSVLLLAFALIQAPLYAQFAKKAELEFEIKLDEETQSMEIIWNSCLENSQMRILNYKGQLIQSVALCKETSVVDLSTYEKGGYSVIIDHYTARGERYVYKDHTGNLEELNALAKKELNFTVGPNPSTDYIDIQSEVCLENSIVQVIDLQGRVVLSQPLCKGYGERLDISRLTQGMYLLRIEHYTAVGVKRIIKQ